MRHRLLLEHSKDRSEEARLLRLEDVNDVAIGSPVEGEIFDQTVLRRLNLLRITSIHPEHEAQNDGQRFGTVIAQIAPNKVGLRGLLAPARLETTHLIHIRGNHKKKKTTKNKTSSLKRLKFLKHLKRLDLDRPMTLHATQRVHGTRPRVACYP